MQFQSETTTEKKQTLIEGGGGKTMFKYYVPPS